MLIAKRHHTPENIIIAAIGIFVGDANGGEVVRVIVEHHETPIRRDKQVPIAVFGHGPEALALEKGDVVKISFRFG